MFFVASTKRQRGTSFSHLESTTCAGIELLLTANNETAIGLSICVLVTETVNIFDG